MSSSLADLKFIAKIAERDVDFILLEELKVSDEFQTWFSSRVYEVPVFKELIGAWHSVSDAGLGESDLVFLFVALDESRKAVLIENKIDATPQLDQRRRYKERGDRGVDDGSWDEFRTCIVAPRRYLNSAKHPHPYESEISYEEILAHFLSRGVRDHRFVYRAEVIREGIEQNRRGYRPKIDRSMTEFVKEYVSFCRHNFPNLQVEDAKPRPVGSTWIMFHPDAKPKGVEIVHQVSAGFIKIFLSGKAEQLDSYISKYSSESPLGVEVQTTGRSVGIVVPVPAIDPIKEEFTQCHDRVTEALTKLGQLVSVARSNGDL